MTETPTTIDLDRNAGAFAGENREFVTRWVDRDKAAALERR